MLIGPDNVRFTRANAIGIRFDAASNNSSHINASPAEDVAVKVLAPAASDPIVALIAECSLSTGTNSVSISPFAIYVETICGISVDGVIGNAGITSGLIWRIAKDTASFPDIRSFLAILSSLLHCDCIKWTGFCTNTASFTVVIIKFYSFTIF